jgi:hypothetical protein
MKKFFLKALYLGVVLGIAGLAGCQNPFEPIRKPVPQGTGRVAITIGDAATDGFARTIAPAESEFTKYTLAFSGPVQMEPVEVTGGSASAELVVGFWTITATGYTGTQDSYVPVAEGSASAEVSSGGDSSLNILLGPKTGGDSGTFNYFLTIPDGLDRAELVISTPEGESVKTVPLAYSSSGIDSSETLESGEYLVRIRLQKNALYAGLTEALHIYSGLVSALPHQEFTDDDFRAAIDKGFNLTSLIPAPQPSATPVGSLADQEQYTGTVAWKEGDTPVAGTFKGNTVYTAIVTLTAKTGYTFTGIAGNSFVHSGAATVANAADTGVVTLAFTATDPMPAPSTNAEHLAMLRSLGVTTTPDLPVAPNGQPYNPQTSSSMARAVTGPARSLGPLGNIFSNPKREIFLAGYYNVTQGKNHILYQDFENSTLTQIGQDAKADDGWAGGSMPRKSVAADLDGDGIDEVVILSIPNKDKILVNRGAYNGSSFTVTQVRELNMPQPDQERNYIFQINQEFYLDYVGWNLIAADLNGDGKKEIVFTIPGVADGPYLYILDNNLSLIRTENLKNLMTRPEAGHSDALVTAADYDQDGKDELCVILGAFLQNFIAPYVILDDRDANFATLHSGTVNTSAAGFSINIGTVLAGDFTGDGLPDTVFLGKRSGDPVNNGPIRVLMLLKTTLDSSFKPVFEWVAAANKEFNVGGAPLVPVIAAGDVNGDRKLDLFAYNRLYTLNSSNTFEPAPGATGDVFDGNYAGKKEGFAYHVVMGDVNGDQKDDVVYFRGYAELQIYYYSSGAYRRFNQTFSTTGSLNETGCLPNVDNDSLILRDTGQREFLFSDPHVVAVLASPPYYEGINAEGDGGTSFGQSTSSGSSSSKSLGFSVGVSIGYEYQVPLVGGGAEYELSVKGSFAWTQSTSIEISESWGWNNPIAQDLVIFTAIPFDVYYYEVLRSPPDAAAKVGDLITIDVPRKPLPYHMSLPTYNSLVPQAHQVTVNHTLGDPASYFTKTQRDNQKSQAGNRGLFSTNTQMSAGEGTGSTTINIETVTGTDSSFNFDLEVEISGKKKFPGGVAIGASAGFQYGYESTSSVSDGTYIEGTVPAIPGTYYTADRDFTWGLMAYPKQDPNQDYIFVTYWTNLN